MPGHVGLNRETLIQVTGLVGRIYSVAPQHRPIQGNHATVLHGFSGPRSSSTSANPVARVRESAPFRAPIMAPSRHYSRTEEGSPDRFTRSMSTGASAPMTREVTRRTPRSRRTRRFLISPLRPKNSVCSGITVSSVIPNGGRTPVLPAAAVHRFELDVVGLSPGRLFQEGLSQELTAAPSLFRSRWRSVGQSVMSP